MTNARKTSREGSKRVLIIEDEPDSILLYRTKLEHEQYEVFTADGPEDGLAIAKAKHPAIVLLDLMLPHRSGFEILEDLKRDPTTRHIPVLALTNLAEEVGFERAIKSGAVGYALKAECPPIRLVSLIREILHESPPKETRS